MAEEKDPPIVEPGFIAGVKVVNIGDVRVARGMTRRSSSSCPHQNLVYDERERRIWCQDCEKDVEPYDAFVILTKHFHDANSVLEKRQTALKEAEQHKLISLASKVMDEAWRMRSMVPTCPSCGQGIFPEDFKNGVKTKLGKDYATARRAAINKPVPKVSP